MMRRLIIALSLFAFPMTATAFDGSDLYRFCSGTERSYSNACNAFIRGFHEGLMIGDRFASEKTHYCPPTNMGIPQARLIVEKYLRDNPNKLHAAAGALVAGALYEAFGCGTGKRPEVKPSR